MHWYTIPFVWLVCAVAFNFLKGIWMPTDFNRFESAIGTIFGTVFSPVGMLIMVCITAYKAGEALRIGSEKEES